MDEFDPRGEVDVVLDEYGVWRPPAPGTVPCSLWRQYTQRDGLAAAIMLDVLNRQAHRVAMANIAQMINVPGAQVATRPPGARMIGLDPRRWCPLIALHALLLGDGSACRSRRWQ